MYYQNSELVLRGILVSIYILYIYEPLCLE